MSLKSSHRNRLSSCPENETQKSLQERVAAILPASALYTQLLQFESRVDAALFRKKLDIQDSLQHPPTIQKTLRIYVFNTFSNPGNPNPDPPTWTLKITGRILDPDQPGFVNKSNPLSPNLSRVFLQKAIDIPRLLLIIKALGSRG